MSVKFRVELEVQQNVEVCISVTSQPLLFLIFHVTFFCGCTRRRSWLRFCATNRKVVGSIADGVIGTLG
jgi:hypothetical protein